MTAISRSGSNAKTAISRDGMVWADVSAAIKGFDGLDITEEEGTVDLAGGGNRTGMITTGYVTVNTSFTVDENELSRPVLTGFNGGTLHVRYRREGDGSGKPQAIYVGPVTVSWTADARGKRRYSVDMMVDGAPNKENQT